MYGAALTRPTSQLFQSRLEVLGGFEPDSSLYPKSTYDLRRRVTASSYCTAVPIEHVMIAI